ncbi:MAG: hypothetical protein WA888_11145 [Burkholderiaceae bacterium]
MFAMFEYFEVEIYKNWQLYYHKCTRFDGMQLNWDNNPAFSLVDAMGIGHTILMLPMRLLLKILDMLQPVAIYFNIGCGDGRSGDWMLGSALLWVLIIATALQLWGWKRVRKSAG